MWASVCTFVLDPNKVRGEYVHTDHPLVSLVSISLGGGNQSGEQTWTERASSEAREIDLSSTIKVATA